MMRSMSFDPQAVMKLSTISVFRPTARLLRSSGPSLTESASATGRSGAGGAGRGGVERNRFARETSILSDPRLLSGRARPEVSMHESPPARRPIPRRPGARALAAAILALFAASGCQSMWDRVRERERIFAVDMARTQAQRDQCV